MNNTSTLWEDTDLTEQWKKSESKLIFAPSDGINETKNVSVESVCEDIGKKKKWIKLCPNCGTEQHFNTKHGFEYGLKHNTRCSVCKSRGAINYVGMRVGTLTVIKQYYTNGSGDLRVDYMCDCGVVKTNIQSSKMRLRKMCSICKKKNKHKILPNGDAAFNKLWSSYRGSAKRRNLKFELTREEFKTLTKQNCVYCGTTPNNIMKPTVENCGDYVYNGIDRKDNSIGYTIENCVPACKNCNFFKFQLTRDEFLNHVKKIYEYQLVEGRR